MAYQSGRLSDNSDCSRDEQEVPACDFLLQIVYLWLVKFAGFTQVPHRWSCLGSFYFFFYVCQDCVCGVQNKSSISLKWLIEDESCG